MPKLASCGYHFSSKTRPTPARSTRRTRSPKWIVAKRVPRVDKGTVVGRRSRLIRFLGAGRLVSEAISEGSQSVNHVIPYGEVIRTGRYFDGSPTRASVNAKSSRPTRQLGKCWSRVEPR